MCIYFLIAWWFIGVGKEGKARWGIGVFLMIFIPVPFWLFSGECWHWAAKRSDTILISVMGFTCWHWLVCTHSSMDEGVNDYRVHTGLKKKPHGTLKPEKRKALNYWVKLVLWTAECNVLSLHIKIMLMKVNVFSLFHVPDVIFGWGMGAGGHSQW